ncbi:MAG: hypothetical protein KAY65_03025 [Planctomycetes bacterium]|nr:hypothetical protein [Planctomycetota bacterium]
MSAQGSWVEAMAKAKDERTRRSRIVEEVQKNIEFFRQKWSDFCEMVEECGEHVDGCRNDAACEYRVGEQALVAQLEAVKTALEEAKRSGTSADFTRLEEQRKELWQTRSGLPLAEPPEKGCKLYNYENFLYLNIPMDPLFWIRPGQIDPTPWLLRDYAWDLTDTERLIPDSALLSIVHDNHGLSGIDRRVYQHVVYTGKYFKRDCFCSKVLEVLRGQDTLDRIQRAYDRVLPAIKKKREKPAETEQDRKATIAAIIISLFVICIFLLSVWLVPFTPFSWLKNHSKNYALQGSIICLIPCLIVGLLKRQWRKWCWGVAGLAFLVLLVSLLGGTSADSNAN